MSSKTLHEELGDNYALSITITSVFSKIKDSYAYSNAKETLIDNAEEWQIHLSY